MWPTHQTPAIRISSDASRPQDAPSSSLTSSTSSRAIPMPIPNSRDAVPPPLPPPRHIDQLKRGQDPGWSWANGVNRPDPINDFRQPEPVQLPNFSRIRADQPRDTSSRPPFSQSLPAPPTERNPPIIERTEQREDDSLPRPGLARLQSETQLSLRTLNSAAHQFDRHLLSKLNGSSSSRPGGAANLPSPRDSSSGRRNGSALKPLRVPDYRHGGPDSPLRWPGSSPSAVSSASAGIKSPLFDSGSIDHTISPPYNRSQAGDSHDDYRRPSNSLENSGLLDPELMEEGPLRDLNLCDRSSVEDHTGASRKRRAPSPTFDDRDRHAPHNDLYHRRSMQMLNHRTSPPRRLPHPMGSVSTQNSLAHSAGSQWSMAPSSMTSFHSERISPGALSPPGDYDYNRLPALPDVNEPMEANAHRDRRLDKYEMDGQNSLLMSMNAAGLYACECCIKKPRRFRTLDELRLHEAEKQFQCQFCPNRFKNKNEAERHQNSLHLRKYSWSCAALSSGRQAFHKHPTRQDTTDICGYCGNEFANNPPNWRHRNEHLVNEHKFGECNQQKKFFRADHFRQHLKHSHGAASGKWTGQLETICIKEEPMPEPLRPSMLVPPPSMQMPPPAPISSIPPISAPAPLGPYLNDTPQPQQQ